MIIRDTLYVDLETELSQEEFDLQLDESEETLDLELDNRYVVTQIIGDPYEGEYEIDPTFEKQMLSTKHKTLSDDLTVNAIEVSRVSNIQGGTTVYIGGIFNA